MRAATADGGTAAPTDGLAAATADRHTAATGLRSSAPPVLVIDTATTWAVVALGTLDGALVAADEWEAGHRHAEELLVRIAGLLAGAGIGRPAPGILAGIVAGTGPGGFTGLRVGLATAHGIARAAAAPLVGVPTGAALAAAARATGAVAADAAVAVLLPAGPAGRYLVHDGRATLVLRDDQAGDAPAGDALPGNEPGSAPPGNEPGSVPPGNESGSAPPGSAAAGGAPPGATLVAVDLPGRAPKDAAARGAVARAGLAAALLVLGAARLRAGADDGAGLTPEYVTMPRGVTASSGEVAWSPARP